MPSKPNLAALIEPWIKNIPLPNGYRLVIWPYKNSFTIQGESHWYVETADKAKESWLVTVRGDHVEVRDDNDDGPMALNWHTISAADPEFFPKLERDIRAALNYLSRN